MRQNECLQSARQFRIGSLGVLSIFAQFFFGLALSSPLMAATERKEIAVGVQLDPESFPRDATHQFNDRLQRSLLIPETLPNGGTLVVDLNDGSVTSASLTFLFKGKKISLPFSNANEVRGIEQYLLDGKAGQLISYVKTNPQGDPDRLENLSGTYSGQSFAIHSSIKPRPIENRATLAGSIKNWCVRGLERVSRWSQRKDQ